MLQMAYHYNGVTIEQLRRRFFPDRSHNAYYRRIRRLVSEGYLHISRAPSLHPIGAPLGLITLGSRARPMLAEMMSLPRGEVARATRAASPLVVPHRAAIGDFHLSLELAVEMIGQAKTEGAAGPPVELAEWFSEVELASSPIIVSDSKLVFGERRQIKVKIIPDAAFTLTTPQGSLTAYLEMDMATVTARLRDNLRAYLLHRRTLATPRPVLFVVPDQKRQATIARWVLAEAKALAADPTIFLLSTKERINERTILLEPIWQVVGGPPAQALISGPGPSLASCVTYGHSMER